MAIALYTADEFTRAAATLDEILPRLRDSTEAPLLRYYAGVSHAEIGDIEPAIACLTAYLPDADGSDPLYRDAIYQLGVLLAGVGRVQDGLTYLTNLRPLLAAEYGPASIHVASLDKRINQVRRQLEP